MSEEQLAEIEARLAGWMACGRFDCRHEQCLPVRLLAEIRRLRAAGRTLAMSSGELGNAPHVQIPIDGSPFYVYQCAFCDSDRQEHASGCPWQTFVDVFGERR